MIRREDMLFVRGNRARMGAREMICAIGWGGIGEKIGEGDGVTPFGAFRLLFWMARMDRIAPARAVQAIGPSQVWSDDPRDPAYNLKRRWPEHGLSHERLARPDQLYNLVGVLGYNLPDPKPGKGSAIFLHVWRGPLRATEGCVAFAPKDLTWIHEHWRPWSRVVIRS